MLKTQQMIKARAYFHEQYAKKVIARIAGAGILHQTDVLESLKGLEPHIRPVEPSEKLFKTTSLISRIQTMLTALQLGVHRARGAKAELILDSEVDGIDQELSALEQEYSIATSRQTLPDLEGTKTTGLTTDSETERPLSELSRKYA